jgi:hypothetical protein
LAIPAIAVSAISKSSICCKLIFVSRGTTAHVHRLIATNLPESLSLSRLGPRPHMPESLPYLQLDQWPSPALVSELLARASALPHVLVRQSRMASPETVALALPDEFAFGIAEAFIDIPEFCHLHPLPRGGMHVTLPFAVRAPLLELGWVEEHPAARTGSVSPCLVQVYAPRDQRELAAAMSIIDLSLEFAGGR